MKALIANIRKYYLQVWNFLIADMFEIIYASFESSCWDFQSILVKTSMFIKSDFVDNRLIIVDHANSFAPLMDAVCPQRFLIECVDAK